MPTMGLTQTVVPWVEVTPEVPSFLQKASGDTLSVPQLVASHLNGMTPGLSH